MNTARSIIPFRQTGRSGFTLVELLVTIGIIALLIGLSLAAYSVASRAGKKAVATAQLGQLSQALANYHQDFGDYPRLGVVPSGPAWPTVNGAQLLAWALVAPGDATQDGAAGNGFRVLPGGFGPVHGPYLTGYEKFKFTTNDDSAELLDPWGSPYLYIPARAASGKLTNANAFVADSTTTPGALFDALYIDVIYMPTGVAVPTITQLESIVGADTTGALPANTIAKTTGPFVLWSAGTDGLFGTADDVTNVK